MNKTVLSQDNYRRWKACINYQRQMFAIACLVIAAVTYIIIS